LYGLILAARFLAIGKRGSGDRGQAARNSYWALDATHSLDSYGRRWCLRYGYEHGDPADIEVHPAEEEPPLVIAWFFVYNEQMFVRREAAWSR
jgi:hypothetical protein